MAPKPTFTKFNLCVVRWVGLPELICMGLRVTDDIDVTREYNGKSYDAFGFSFKERKVDFELIDPRDQATLYEIVAQSRKGITGTIIGFGNDEDDELVPVQRVDGCIVPGYERQIGSQAAIKPSIKGFAMDTEVINTEFE